jgi:Zn-dependent peptidase ImmA (M78 family)
VYELWGFSISVEVIPQNEDEEALGFLRPEARQVVVDENCTNQKRISFTVGHEAGHLSLHGPLFKTENGLIVGWATIQKSRNKKKLDTAHHRREWQANVYAGTLLAPEMDVRTLLEELGLVKNLVLSPFNLDDHFVSFESRFGLSRQSLEIRLGHLGVPFQGARYRSV